MCSPAMCSCGKFGWTGCGDHVADVMREVPAANRCDCGATEWLPTA